MAKIETILGPIKPEELGVTDMHNHLIREGGMEVVQDRDFLINDVEKSIVEAKDFHDAGGNSIVDMDPIGCGRSIAKMLKIAKQVPVHIIQTTGFHQSALYISSLWWANRYTIDEVADLFAKEVLEGIDINDYTGPIVNRSTSKAGVIKAGTGYANIKPSEEKVLRAVARAHLKTGAPISTHTSQGSMGVEQCKILKEEGADLSHVIIGHLDLNPDPENHIEIASMGANVQYDSWYRVKYHGATAHNTIELITKLIDAGHGKQIVLGGDHGRASYLKAYGGGPGIASTLRKLVPRLKGVIGEKAVDDILVNNPKRILTFK